MAGAGFEQALSLAPLGIYPTGQALWFRPPGTVPATALFIAAQLKVAPWFFARPTPVAALGLEVTGAGTVGSVVRVLAYQDNGSGMPGALIYDSGAIFDGTSATVQQQAPAGLPTLSGLVWIGCVSQGAPATEPTMRNCNATTQAGSGLPAIGTTNPATASTVVLSGYQMNGVAGAGPGAFVNAGAVNTPSAVLLKVA